MLFLNTKLFATLELLLFLFLSTSVLRRLRSLTWFIGLQMIQCFVIYFKSPWVFINCRITVLCSFNSYERVLLLFCSFPNLKSKTNLFNGKENFNHDYLHSTRNILFILFIQFVFSSNLKHSHSSRSDTSRQNSEKISSTLEKHSCRIISPN